MVSQRDGLVGFATLTYALVHISGSAFASTASTSLSYSFATTSSGCIDSYIADGDCDLVNDNVDCGYDGGDCCECTCVSTEDYTCGENGGYSCLDPSSPCVDDDDVTTLPSSERYCIHEFIGDGDCDEGNNYSECDYDGGDCCKCTCVTTEHYTCGDETTGGFACIDPTAPCVDDDDDIVVGFDDNVVVDRTPTSSFFGDDAFGGDTDDPWQNYSYDEWESFSYGEKESYSYGEIESFSYGEGESYSYGERESYSYGASDEDLSYEYSPCLESFIGDGECDSENNNAQCDYDGGDCCECDCQDILFPTCGEYTAFDCIDPTSICAYGYVDAGTITTITASANAYDMRPGVDNGDSGCLYDGCAPALTRDGISCAVESRWSCSRQLVADGGYCAIEFAFEDPQDIMEVQVAFWRGDESTRILEAAINGEVTGSFSSYPGSTFNALGITGSGVSTLLLTSISIDADEWTGLIEVRFLVKP